jgi:hypothetical protein
MFWAVLIVAVLVYLAAFALFRKGLLISAGLTMLAAALLPVASVWGTVSAGHTLAALCTFFAMLPLPVTLVFWGLIRALSGATDSSQPKPEETIDD